MKIGFQSSGQNLILSKSGVSILQATQSSDTICSGPALKLARSLCIVQIPGSNRLHTQFHDAISQQRSFYYKLHSSRLAQE